MSSKAGARYAKSLIDLSTERNALEEIKNDMVFFEDVVDTNSELEAILKNPIVPLDKKAGILNDIFGNSRCYLCSYYPFIVIVLTNELLCSIKQNC